MNNIKEERFTRAHSVFSVHHDKKDIAIQCGSPCGVRANEEHMCAYISFSIFFHKWYEACLDGRSSSLENLLWNYPHSYIQRCVSLFSHRLLYPSKMMAKINHHKWIHSGVLICRAIHTELASQPLYDPFLWNFSFLCLFVYWGRLLNSLACSLEVIMTPAYHVNLPALELVSSCLKPPKMYRNLVLV